MQSTRTSNNQNAEQSTSLLLTKALNGAEKVIQLQKDVQDGQFYSLVGGLLLMNSIDAFIKFVNTGSWAAGAEALLGSTGGLALLDNGIRQLWKAVSEDVDNKKLIKDVKADAIRLGLFVNPANTPETLPPSFQPATSHKCK